MKIITLAILVLFSVTNAYANSYSDWEGEYLFEETGKSKKDGAFRIMHRIRIAAVGDKHLAHIYTNGYKTNRDVYATVKFKDSRAELFFDSYGPDHQSSKFKENESLLVLEWSEGSLLTIWRKMRPRLVENDLAGMVQFQKSESKDSNESPGSWKRVNFEAGKISLLLPANYIANKKKEYRYLARYHGGLRNASVYLSVTKIFRKQTRKKLLKGTANPRIILAKPIVVRSNGILRIGNNYSKVISIYGEKRDYRIQLNWKGANPFFVNQVFEGIRANGKKLTRFPSSFEVDTETDGDNEPTSQVFKRFAEITNEGVERRVSYQASERPKEFPKQEFDRQAVVFERARPKKYPKTKVVAWVEMRANGQIGEIKFYSTESEKRIRPIMKVIMKMRFVPAVKDGKFVDSWQKMTWFAPIRIFI